MDPNLRTLSLAAWMSLPNFDFATWQSLNRDESMDDKYQMELDEQSLSSNNKRPKILTNSCTKCESLRNDERAPSDRSGSIISFKNNNNEVSPSVCKRANVSLKFNSTDDKRSTVTDKKSKGEIRSTVGPGQVGSKETQSRALVSKVAKYYEDYVSHMKLQKNFVNDVIVTSIVPVQWKDPKCKAARWIVVG